MSSLGHESTVPSGIDFETLNDPTASGDDTRYGRSKLANILFGKALARRLAQEKVFVNITHPGCVETEASLHGLVPKEGESIVERLQRNLEGFVSRFFDYSARAAALTPLYLGTSPEIEEKDIRGRYFIPIANEIQPSLHARNEDLQEKLWTFSESLAKEKTLN